MMTEQGQNARSMKQPVSSESESASEGHYNHEANLPKPPSATYSVLQEPDLAGTYQYTFLSQGTSNYQQENADDIIESDQEMYTNADYSMQDYANADDLTMHSAPYDNIDANSDAIAHTDAVLREKINGEIEAFQSALHNLLSERNLHLYQLIRPSDSGTQHVLDEDITFLENTSDDKNTTGSSGQNSQQTDHSYMFG
ncbi:unnamed protein product, partial [Owenia fusiformis]